MSRNASRLIIVAILLLAFGLRLTRLGHQELRGDEAFGYFFTQQSYAGIVTQTIALDEPHPVASYFVLKAWQAAVGRSEFALRFVSVWFGVLAVALTARVARRLGLARRTELVGAFLLALSPFAVWHAQDARMYAMSLALSTAVVWLAIEALARRRWPWIAAYIGAAWLALHTHYFAGFVLVALSLFVVGRALVAASARRAVFDWLLWNAVLAVAYLPWLTSAGTILAGYGGNGDSPTLVAMAPRSLAAFAVGESLPAPQRVLWASVLALACSAGALRLWMGGPGTRRALWLLACWGIVPVMLTWYGALDRPIFNERYLIAAAPAFLLLAAAAVQPVPRPRIWLNGAAALLLALLVGGMVASLWSYYTNPAFSKTRGWRTLAAQMLTWGDGLPAGRTRFAQNYPDPTLWYYTGAVEHLVLPPAAQDGAGAAREVEALAQAGVARVVLALQHAPTWDVDGLSQRGLDADYDLAASLPVAGWTVQLWARTAQTLPPRTDLFGDRIRLTGAEVNPGTLIPGGVLTAQLAWRDERAPETPSQPLAMTLQLLGSDGALVAQRDAPLEPGPEDSRVHYGILVPETLAPGEYHLIVALYAPEVVGAPRLVTETGADRVELARLTVAAGAP